MTLLERRDHLPLPALPQGLPRAGPLQFALTRCFMPGLDEFTFCLCDPAVQGCQFGAESDIGVDPLLDVYALAFIFERPIRHFLSLF